MSYLIGIDVGTTNCKAIACDHNGKFLATHSRPTIKHYLENGWAEFHANELWENVLICIEHVVKEMKDETCDGLAVSSMGVGGLVDENGDHVHPIIAWFDPRTDAIAKEWKQYGSEKIYEITGINPNAVATITKIQWIKQNRPECYQKAKHWLQIQDLISFKLTGETRVSYPSACRTMAFDLNQMQWSKEILEIAGISPELLPEPVPSGTLVGKVTPEVEKLTKLKAGTPVFAGGLDYACGAFATGIIDTGQMLDSTGTSEQVLAIMDKPILNASYMEQNFTSLNHVIQGKYVTNGMITTSGGVFEWFKKEFQGNSFDELIAEAEKSPIGANGCMLIPYFSGRYSLGFDANARGAFVGLTTATKRGDMVRALLEGLCYEMAGMIEVIQNMAGIKVSSIYAIGGAAKSDFWLQLKADVSGIVVKSKNVPESPALGAAMLAGLGAGIYKSPADAVAHVQYPEKVYTPNPENHQKYKKINTVLYKKLYGALKGFNDDLRELQI